jgi:1,4-dihydroxy-2-naphthoate polyprenyltransferase
VNVWVEAARPRTLPAAVAPVLVGTAAAERFILWRAAAALVVALAFQVGVNYANDHFDAVRGVDSEDRVGPRRAVAAGLVSPERMRVAMVLAFTVAGIAGLVLAAATTWWLVAVGGLCVLAAAGYSGGPRPYASLGLGELFVFVFFGLVATVGSQFVQDEVVLVVSVVAAVPVGLLAVAILVVNNLRDIPTDRASGKATLAVRLGDPATRNLYAALLIAAAAGVTSVAAVTLSPGPLLALVAAPLGWRAHRIVTEARRPTALIPALEETARLHLAVGILLASGLVIA